MNNNDVWVSEHMAANFMKMAKPQYPFTVERFRQQYVFRFSNSKDLESAEKANGTLILTYNN